MTARQWQGEAGWQPRPPAAGGVRGGGGGAGPALAVINPNSSQAVTDGIAAALAPLEGWGTPIRCLTLAEGPPGIETQAQADAVVPPLLALAAEQEADAAAFVIACFSDPGLHALRECSARPVAGIGEAAYLAAMATGDRFGILSILPASVVRHRRALRAMGIESRCAGDRALGLGVAELADRSRAGARMAEVARALRDEDGADVLILGCAGMAHAKAGLEEAIGLPVVEPCQAGAALALARIRLGLGPGPAKRPEAAAVPPRATGRAAP